MLWCITWLFLYAKTSTPAYPILQLPLCPLWLEPLRWVCVELYRAKTGSGVDHVWSFFSNPLDHQSVLGGKLPSTPFPF